VRPPLFYGWIVVAVAFVTMALGVNARTSFSLLFPHILDEFGWDRGLTAGAFSVGFLVTMVFTPWMGHVMDQHGPRWVIGAGILAVGAGMALAPIVATPWHLYVTLGALVSGGTLACGYTAHALFLPNWFVRKRGLAIGIAFAGVGVGSIAMLPGIQVVIERAGWRTACWATAAVVLAVLLPLNLLQRRGPEELGLRPDGDAATPARAAGTHPANVLDPAWASIEWTLGRAARTARFWWIAVAYLGALAAWYAVQVHQTKYMIEVGYSPALAAWALGLVGFAGIGGQIGLGHLSDRVGREWVWSLACAGYVISYTALLLMPAYPTPALVYVMVGAQGLLGYGLASVYGAIPAEIFQGKHYGTVFGTLSIFSSLGAAVGPWVAGALHDHTGAYTSAFWLAIAASIVSAIAIWLAAPRKVRAVAGRIPEVDASHHAAETRRGSG
jgi:MFS family permease